MEQYQNQGLTSQQALQNQRRFGLNQLAKKTKKGIFWRFLEKLLNPMIIILLLAALLSFLLGQKSDFLVISIIIAISLTFDVLQEHRAENATEKLKQKIALTTEVLRDGIKQQIPNTDLTIDDIIFLNAGDIVPADALLLETNSLLVDQSALTGESYPKSKNAGTADNLVFMGTIVVSGNAIAKVVQIGQQTQLGQISKKLISKKPATEFEKGLNSFAFLLVKLTFIFAFLLVFTNVLIVQREFVSSLLFVLALAIGFAPELLPMVVTINLAKGALSLSKKGVIVKFLPSIENFGSMDILCTDKTGTLTENRTSLESYQNLEGQPDEKVFFFGYLNSYFHTGFKNPIDEAILAHQKISTSDFEKIGEIPFDFSRKRKSVILKQKNKTYLICKGAPESVLAVSQKLDQKTEKKIKTSLEAMAREGFRTIAVSIKEISNEKQEFSLEDEKNLKLLGIMAFVDPPKAGAQEIVKSLKNSGVAIKILTGDSELVTEHIWKQLSLPEAKIILASKLENLNEEEFSKAVEENDIFARLNPTIKEKIVTTLKKNKHVVGFLGDGINDATSLKAADIGISVNNAVDVAKEAADLILLHKDLKILHTGILEGRRIFANILKYIVMGTSSTFGNMLSLAVSSLFLPFLPMLPVQVLLNDLLYDTSQTLVAQDNVDQELVAKPRKWDVGFIKNYMLSFGVLSSLFDLLTFCLLFVIFKATPPLFRTGWFLESILTQTLIIFSIRTVKVPFWKSRPSRSFAFGLLGIVAFAVLLPHSFLAKDFHFVKLPVLFYPILLLIILCYFLTTEIVKAFFYAKHH